MRCSSGSVSWLTSMTGGWYVWIIDMGRVDRRESERSRWYDCEELRSWYESEVASGVVLA